MGAGPVGTRLEDTSVPRCLGLDIYTPSASAIMSTGSLSFGVEVICSADNWKFELEGCLRANAAVAPGPGKDSAESHGNCNLILSVLGVPKVGKQSMFPSYPTALPNLFTNPQAKVTSDLNLSLFSDLRNLRAILASI